MDVNLALASERAAQRAARFGLTAFASVPMATVEPVESSGSKPFDFGEYSTTQEEDGEHPLSWRDDPEKSLSDWTIIIAKADQSNSTYHVHKAILAAGARSSDYFKSVFRGAGSGMREGDDRTSRLELENSAADAFPAYLDFAYFGGKLFAHTESATALLHLANYLRCRALHNAVTEFMQGNLNGDTAALYLAEAELYSLDKVSAVALPLCAAALPTARPELVLALPPPLFQRVVLAPERICTSEKLSKLVAQYCRGPHAESVDGPFLTSMSSSALLPSIDPTEALSLLELAVTHTPKTGLEERCIAAAANHWQQALIPVLATQAAQASPATDHKSKRHRGTDNASEEEVAPVVAREPELGSAIPDMIKVTLLAASLKAAHASLEAEKAARAARESELSKQISDLTQSKNKADHELRRFTRIAPDDTLGGAIPSEILDKLTYSAKNEQIQPTGFHFPPKAKYGKTPPSHVPSHAPSKEGWIYKAHRGQICPVFYYK